MAKTSTGAPLFRPDTNAAMPEPIKVWKDLHGGQYEGDLAYFGAGRLCQQMAYHLRQAAALRDDSRCLPLFLTADPDRPPNVEGATVRWLQQKWDAMATLQDDLASHIVEQLHFNINRFLLGSDEIERLRRKLTTAWEDFFPASPVDDWLGDGPDAAGRWVESSLHRLRSVLVKHNSASGNLLFAAGELFESARCRNDIGRLLLPDADKLKWPAFRLRTSLDASHSSDGASRDASFEHSEYEVDDGKPLTPEELERWVRPRNCRQVGELRPEPTWHFTFENVLRKLRPAATSLTAETIDVPRNKPRTERELGDFLAQVHHQIGRAFGSCLHTPRDVLNGPFGLKFDRETNKLTGAITSGAVKSTTVPTGPLRNALISLLMAGKRGVSPVDLASHCYDEEDRPEGGDLGALQAVVTRLRRLLKGNFNLTIRIARLGKRYEIIRDKECPSPKPGKKKKTPAKAHEKKTPG